MPDYLSRLSIRSSDQAPLEVTFCAAVKTFDANNDKFVLNAKNSLLLLTISKKKSESEKDFQNSLFVFVYFKY